jgi:hypothetical protein
MPEEDRLVVYTVLMGQIAELNPVVEDPGVDYICFTDQNLDSSNGWTLRLVEPRIPGDSPRSSRHPKVNPHLYLRDYSRSIYVDTSVKLLADPELLWNRLVPKSEIVFGAIYHSYHFTMLEEIGVTLALGFGENELITQYVESKEIDFPGYLNARPVWGGILARRHNHEELRPLMESWYSAILNFSRRDQLSLPSAIRSLRGSQIYLSHMDNHTSEFHSWPSGGYQKPASYILVNQVKEDWRVKQPPERDALLIERDALLTERDALLNSGSWKITSGLRALRGFLCRPELKSKSFYQKL